jgi:hypothetical protein
MRIKWWRKRLIFAIDATASRQPAWDVAAQIHGQVFVEALARVAHHIHFLEADNPRQRNGMISLG